MNGRFILDTNAIIEILKGNHALLVIINQAKWIGISVISELEFLSFSNLLEEDKLLFQKFKKRIEIVSLNSTDSALIEEVLRIRKRYGLKLPDAIIAATASSSKANLVTADLAFLKITEITVVSF